MRDHPSDRQNFSVHKAWKNARFYRDPWVEVRLICFEVKIRTKNSNQITCREKKFRIRILPWLPD